MSCTSYLNSTVYDKEQKYWSQQQSDTYPTCRFTPRHAADVSAAILTIRETECPFAVKSGGHASFKGGSNIEGGVTIDLSGLNTIEVSSDKTVTSVGSGNRWDDIYTKLNTLKLAVVGGRNGDIGVGGLTLGGMHDMSWGYSMSFANASQGGISFFSGLYGWACDNVKNYEVSS